MYEQHHHGFEGHHHPHMMWGGREREHGGNDRRFDPGGRHHGPGMPGEEWAEFVGSAGEGDGSGRDNSRIWRGGGGPHGFGRGRPDFGFGFGFGGRQGRPERPLEQGDLRWLVLDLINVQPRHGYEIIKAIEEMMSGFYTPSPGMIYPTLTFLEETGLIASEAQATKKLYTITDDGRVALEENAAAIQAIRARIGEVRSRFGGPPAPEMTRAMENLRAAIQVRLAKGELSSESLAIVTAALDRAASEIEQS